MDELKQVQNYLEKQQIIRNYEIDTNTNVNSDWINDCRNYCKTLKTN